MLSSAVAMNSDQIRSIVDETWASSIVPTLENYIRIPNQSPLFDPDWKSNGHMDRAVALALVCGALGSAPLVPWLEQGLARLRARPGFAAACAAIADGLTQVALLAMLVVCAAWLAAGTHNPFIYFRF